MTSLQIEIGPSAEPAPDEPRPIRIRLGDQVLTRLLRPESQSPDEWFRAPPGQLAFWLVDNWWRLRYECAPAGRPGTDWLMSHCLSSIGGGFAWPRVRLWGDGLTMTVKSLRDVGAMTPVQYLTDSLGFVLFEDFEAHVDAFLALVSDDRSLFTTDALALGAAISALHEERSDVSASEWRRLEAMAGYDVDEAPEELIRRLGQQAERLGKPSLDEALQAAPGANAVETMLSKISQALGHGWKSDLTEAARYSSSFDRAEYRRPWQMAEDVARLVRRALTPVDGVVKTAALAGFAGISREALSSNPHGEDNYGVRYGTSVQDQRILFRTRSHRARRFELTRAIGDAVWSDVDPLGPLALSRTARQQFQNAFAQSVLCPYEDLEGFVGPLPGPDDLEDAADHFQVSVGVIQTLLVNKGQLDRETLLEGDGGASW